MQGGIEIVYDRSKLFALERQLRGIKNGLPRVVSLGLNKTATTIRSRTVKRIAALTSMKQKYIRRSIKIKKANFKVWMARMRIIGRGIPILRYNAKQTDTGVQYDTPEGGKGLLEHAFIAKMPSGHRGVFSRVGKSRLPIKEAIGPSMADLFDTYPGLASTSETEAVELLDHYIDQSLRHVLEKNK